MKDVISTTRDTLLPFVWELLYLSRSKLALNILNIICEPPLVIWGWEWGSPSQLAVSKLWKSTHVLENKEEDVMLHWCQFVKDTDCHYSFLLSAMPDYLYSRYQIILFTMMSLHIKLYAKKPRRFLVQSWSARHSILLARKLLCVQLAVNIKVWAWTYKYIFFPDFEDLFQISRAIFG